MIYPTLAIDLVQIITHCPMFLLFLLNSSLSWDRSARPEVWKPRETKENWSSGFRRIWRSTVRWENQNHSHTLFLVRYTLWRVILTAMLLHLCYFLFNENVVIFLSEEDVDVDDVLAEDTEVVFGWSFSVWVTSPPCLFIFMLMTWCYCFFTGFP